MHWCAGLPHSIMVQVHSKVLTTAELPLQVTLLSLGQVGSMREGQHIQQAARTHSTMARTEDKFTEA